MKLQGDANQYANDNPDHIVSIADITKKDERKHFSDSYFFKWIKQSDKKDMVNEKHVLLVDVTNENKEVIEAGTEVTIVAIAAKVRYTSKYDIDKDPQRYDSCEYFYNAVVGDNPSRIRECFATIGIR